MASKDFKVKNGLVVGGSGLFDSDVDILGQLKINGTVVINSGGILVTQYSGFDSDFAARLASSNTDSIQEGLTNLYYTTARVDSDITDLVDSAYIQARQIIGGVVSGVDSAAIINLIDSDYIQARQIIGGVVSGVDSADIINLIDSDYIQARQIIGGEGGGGLDSTAIINLIDSDYIQARQIIGGEGGSGISIGAAIAMAIIFGN